MTDYIGYDSTDQMMALENVTPNSVQNSNSLSNDITQIKNGICCYTDMLQDAMQALTFLQRRVRAHESHGGPIPVHSMQELMDAVDVDYLTDELPGALDAFEESLNRLQTVRDIIVTHKPAQKRPVPAVSVSGNVIQFPGRIV